MHHHHALRVHMQGQAAIGDAVNGVFGWPIGLVHYDCNVFAVVLNGTVSCGLSLRTGRRVSGSRCVRATIQRAAFC